MADSTVIEESEELIRTGSGLGDYLRSFIFQTEDVERPEANLADPSQFGILQTASKTSFFIPSSVGRIGAWYLEPENDESLPMRNQAVLYLHGVKGTRGRGYRVGVYNLLLQLGFKVLTIDYRGFGDSSKVSVSEESLLEDSLAGLSWLRERVGPQTDILVFAHSLGTALAARTLAQDRCPVSGLILMSPFNNFLDEVLSKFNQTSSCIKNGLWSTVSGLSGDSIPRFLLRKLDIEFRTDDHLLSVEAPVLVLHAEDDDKIPVELARKLVEDLSSKGKTNLELHVYDGSAGYKHHDIYRDPDLPALILRFTSGQE